MPLPRVAATTTKDYRTLTDTAALPRVEPTKFEAESQQQD